VPWGPYDCAASARGVGVGREGKGHLIPEKPVHWLANSLAVHWEMSPWANQSIPLEMKIGCQPVRGWTANPHRVRQGWMVDKEKRQCAHGNRGKRAASGQMRPVRAGRLSCGSCPPDIQLSAVPGSPGRGNLRVSPYYLTNLSESASCNQNNL
jgi:hypothetical protein